MASEQSISCTSCNTAVSGAPAVRTHYRSELHLVNVKRRVSGLAPLSAADFARRAQLLDASRNAALDAKRGAHCDVCQKRFASEKAYRNHKLSRRHRDKLAAALRRGDDWMSSVHSGDADGEALAPPHEHEREQGRGDDEQQQQQYDEVEAVLRARLREWRRRQGYGGVFDDAWFDDAAQALAHLWRGGMFVPFRERLSDAAGLVQYLSQKVCVGHACVQCERTFDDEHAVRKHMRDVGHCAMSGDLDEWMLEYGEFYDWRVDGADDWEEVQPDGDLQHDGDDDDDDDDDDVVVVVADDARSEGVAQQLPVGRLGGEADERGMQDDGAEEVALVVGNRVVGHRSLKRFYKQHVRGDERSEAMEAARAERQLLQLSRRAEQRGALPARVRRLAAAREKRLALLVGTKNYYCRKARFKQHMAVLNSGYRA